MNKSRNMKSGAGYMLRREDYKRVKKMDRQQFENFCKNLYQTAYEEGRRSVPGLILRKCRKQSVRHRESERRDWRPSWKASTADLQRREMCDEEEEN